MLIGDHNTYSALCHILGNIQTPMVNTGCRIKQALTNHQPPQTYTVQGINRKLCTGKFSVYTSIIRIHVVTPYSLPMDMPRWLGILSVAY